MSSSENLNLRISPMPDLLRLFKPLLHPDKFNELVDMLVDREKKIKIEWSNLEKERDSIKEQCGILEKLISLAELDKIEVEEKMLKSERECEELKETIIRLEEDEKVSSGRRERAEERRAKAYEDLSEMTSEKNKNIVFLKNQIVEKDEKVAGIERELQDLKGQKLEVDQRMEEMRREKSEADKTVEGLRHGNTKAVKTIEGLRREKSEADQTVEELRRRNIEDFETIKRFSREIWTVKMEKMSSDQTMAERSSKNSEEADQEIEQLRKRNCDASDIIEKLRHLLLATELKKMSSDRIVNKMRCKLLEAERKVEDLKLQILEAEVDKKRSDETLNGMRKKQSEVDQTMEELKLKNLDAFRGIEELKQQKLKAEEECSVNKKRMENLIPRIMKLEDGLANKLKAKVKDLANIRKPAEKIDPTKELGDANLHVCSGSSKRGSRKLTPQSSSMKEGNENDNNAEINSTDRGYGSKKLKGSEWIILIDSDDETNLGESECGKKEINKKFPSSSQTSFTLKRKITSLKNDYESLPISGQKKKPKPEQM